MFRNTVFRACVAVFALTLVLVPRCLAAGHFGDVSDAWEKAGVMKKMIGLGDLPHAAEAGRDSLTLSGRPSTKKPTAAGRTSSVTQRNMSMRPSAMPIRASAATLLTPTVRSTKLSRSLTS